MQSHFIEAIKFLRKNGNLNYVKKIGKYIEEKYIMYMKSYNGNDIQDLVRIASYIIQNKVYLKIKMDDMIIIKILLTYE